MMDDGIHATGIWNDMKHEKDECAINRYFLQWKMIVYNYVMKKSGLMLSEHREGLPSIQNSS